MITRKHIIQLAQNSFQNGELDERVVTMIVRRLKRSDIKRFLRALRLQILARMVTITLPNKPEKQLQKQFANMFQNKTIQYKEDASLIAGIRIINNDMLYEVSIQDRIEHMLQRVQENL